MAFDNILVTDKAGDGFEKANNAIDKIPLSLSTNGNTLELNLNDTSTLSVPLPLPSAGVVLLTQNGEIAIAGTDPNCTIEVPALEYSYNGVIQNSASISIPFVAPDPALDRFDTVYLDPDTNTIGYTQGTPSVTPTVPTLSGNETALAIIYVFGGQPCEGSVVVWSAISEQNSEIQSGLNARVTALENKKIEAFDTNETDPTLVLKPDGLGGLVWANDEQGGGGTFAFDYRADLSGTTAPPSANGDIRWNNATQASATKLYVDYQTVGGNTINNILTGLSSGDEIFLIDPSNTNNFQRWAVSNATDQTTYVEYDVTLVSDSKTFTNNENLSFVAVLETEVNLFVYEAVAYLADVTTEAGLIGDINRPYATVSDIITDLTLAGKTSCRINCLGTSVDFGSESDLSGKTIYIDAQHIDINVSARAFNSLTGHNLTIVCNSFFNNVSGSEFWRNSNNDPNLTIKCQGDFFNVAGNICYNGGLTVESKNIVIQSMLNGLNASQIRLIGENYSSVNFIVAFSTVVDITVNGTWTVSSGVPFLLLGAGSIIAGNGKITGDELWQSCSAIEIRGIRVETTGKPFNGGSGITIDNCTFICNRDLASLPMADVTILNSYFSMAMSGQTGGEYGIDVTGTSTMRDCTVEITSVGYFGVQVTSGTLDYSGIKVITQTATDIKFNAGAGGTLVDKGGNHGYPLNTVAPVGTEIIEISTATGDKVGITTQSVGNLGGGGGGTTILSADEPIVQGSWSGTTNYVYSVTVTGAVVGDFCIVTPDEDVFSNIQTAGTNWEGYAYCASANTVTVVCRIGSFINIPASSIFTVKVIQ